MLLKMRRFSSVANLLNCDRTFADPSCSRNNNLDALRLLFALTVVLGHSFFLHGRRAEEPCMPSHTGKWSWATWR